MRCLQGLVKSVPFSNTTLGAFSTSGAFGDTVWHVSTRKQVAGNIRLRNQKHIDYVAFPGLTHGSKPI